MVMMPNFKPCCIHSFEFMYGGYGVGGASLAVYETNDRLFHSKEMIAIGWLGVQEKMKTLTVVSCR